MTLRLEGLALCYLSWKKCHGKVSLEQFLRACSLLFEDQINLCTFARYIGGSEVRIKIWVLTVDN